MGGKLATIATGSVLAVLLGLTDLAWRRTVVAEEERVRAEFDVRVRDAEARIGSRMQAYEQVLHGAGAVFGVSERVGRGEFRDYVAALGLGDHYPGVQGLGFSLLVPQDELARHTASLRQAGFPAYEVRPPGRRDPYTSIIYLEPFTGRNLRAFGYDMYSEPVRRAAMEKARDSGKAALAAKVVLVQETDQAVQSGVLIYLPVYRPGPVPLTERERRERLHGWVYMPFRMGDLMDGILGEQSRDLATRIFDGAAPRAESLMFDSEAGLQASAAPRFVSSRAALIIDRPWTIEISSRPPFEARLASRKPLLVGGGGLVFSVMLTALFWTMASGRERALRLAAGMARRLVESQAARESEARFRTMADGAPVLIWVSGPDGRWTWFNQPWLDFTGRTQEQEQESGWAGCIHAQDLERFLEVLGACRDRQEPFTGDFRLRRRDGAHRWMLISGRPRLDEGGQLAGYIGSCVDVTDRREAETALRESEERFRVLVEEAADAFFLHDLEGRFRDVNRRACESLGYTREELLGLAMTDVEQDRGLEEAKREWAKVSAGEHLTLAGHHRRRDGSVFPVELRFGRVTVGGERLQLALARDVTERVRAEQALHRLEAAVEQTPTSILITDAGGVIEYVNPAFERISGYGRAEVLGRPASLLETGKGDDELYRALSATISSGKVWQGRFVSRSKDGRSFTEDAVIAPVLDQHGTIRSYVAVMRDVTRELALRESLADAQRLESVGRLAGGVAHDFNNLLTVLLSASEALRDDLEAGRPVQVGDVDEIRVAGRRAADLTRQLLAFARKQVITPTALDLNAAVRGAESLIRRAILEDVRLELDLCPDLWVARCDRGQIEQVLLNLAVNARDAMPAGGTLTVETRNVPRTAQPDEGGAEADREWVLLRVRDSGEGLSSEARAHLFEPFYTTKPQGKGTGLGLATVYGIVRQNGGEIAVETEVGRGSTFDLRFPRHPGPVQASAPDERPAGVRGTEAVLVVEDDSPVRDITVRALRSAGYAVHEAHGGPDALALLERTRFVPELLVTDVVMPDMNGRQVADEIRRLHPGVRVLFVSGYTQEIIQRHGALEAGVELLAKPFTPSSLLARVRAVLDRPRE